MSIGKRIIHSTVSKAVTVVLASACMLMGCDVDELGSKYKLTEVGTTPVDTADAEATTQPANDAEAKGQPGSGDNVGGATEIVDVDPKHWLALQISAAPIIEGGLVEVTAILSSTLSQDARFVWSIAALPSQTEDNPGQSDFVEMTGDFSVAVGSQSMVFDIKAINDFVREGEERFELRVVEPDLKIEGRVEIAIHDGKDYFKGLVAAGDRHGCALRMGGLFCWGGNRDGELGVSNLTMQPTAIAVPTLESQVEFVDTQLSHSCAIKAGALFCWGRNDSGQIGDDSKMRKISVTPVSGMTSDVSAVGVGNQHTCAIQKGALKCWGNNISGQLGDGTFEERGLPVAVKSMERGVSDVAAGANHTCAVKSGGLFCWGLADFGQLGLGNTTAADVPMPVFNFEQGVTQVSANGSQTCAIKDGRLYCWGNNESGQLGLGTSDNFFQTPQLVSAETDLVSGVAMGLEHTCAVVNAAPYCWGRGAEGQLGNGASNNLTSPSAVEDFNEQIISIAAGSYHTCMIGISMRKCWGQGTDGQVGDGLRATATLPRSIVFP